MEVRGEAQRQQPVTGDTATIPWPELTQLLDPLADAVRLPADPGSPQAARLVLCALESWGLGATGDVAVQLVAELVANAVRHTGARSIGLRIERGQGWIRIEVHDPSRALPCLILSDPHDDSGRGMRMLDEMADRWGVDLLTCGKAVWFELHCLPDTGQDRPT